MLSPEDIQDLTGNNKDETTLNTFNRHIDNFKKTVNTTTNDKIKRPIASFFKSHFPRCCGCCPTDDIERSEANINFIPEGIRDVYMNHKHELHKSYAINYISTTKYHWWSFLPMFLVEQFSKATNVYFLIFGILYTIPAISPVETSGKYGLLVTLAVVVAVSGLKELIEDIRRYKQDRRVNSAKAQVIGPKGVCQWANIACGEICLVKDKEKFPCDLIILKSANADGLAYVETKQLDGESNLKVKTTIPEIAEACADEKAVLSTLARVKCEKPNDKLYRFSGAMTVAENEAKLEVADEISLGPDQLLLRGSSLQNTPWIYGLVINCGRDTKLFQNMKPKPRKISTLEKSANYLVLTPVLLQVVMVLILITGYTITCPTSQGWPAAWYQYSVGDDQCSSKNTFLAFIRFWIQLAGLVPISLFVSVEIVRGFQVLFFSRDKEMIDKERDLPCEVRTSNLNEELGLVSYLFSDKTGTLTANKMVFKRCLINETVYDDDHDPEYKQYIEHIPDPGLPLSLLVDNMQALMDKQRGIPSSKPTYVSKVVIPEEDITIGLEFFRLLAVCHTVLPEVKEDGSIEFNATSPDEAALVKAARQQGFCFESRTNKSIYINVLGQQEEWEVLGILEFSSARKRMSVIARSSVDNKLRLFCKGADTVIFPRLHTDQKHLVPNCENSLEKFAANGLRTLILAYREISEDFYEDWVRDYQAATTKINGREEAVEQVNEAIETDFSLLGVTAIEDKLQEGVPDTLQTLAMAGVKTWVLTGDKQETAINIGLSCGILSESLDVMIISEDNFEDTEAQLDLAIGRFSALRTTGKTEHDFALVVDGKTLNFALLPQLEGKFMALSTMCKTVIACRTSPKHKTEVVEMVRRNDPLKVTLAIGDGANDVGMIQAAHVGVGIVGLEGVEAKLASDFAIGQFRFLKRLMLVHGRWSYKRICKLILYIIYKSILGGMNDFLLQFYNAYTGQPMYDPWLSGIYNIFSTSIPCIILAIADQDISADYALMFPETYIKCKKLTMIRFRVFIHWVFSGVWQAIVIFFLCKASNGPGPYQSGRIVDLWAYGVLSLTIVVIVVHVYLGIMQSFWTLPMAIIFVISMTSFIWIACIYTTEFFTITAQMSPPMYNASQIIFSQSVSWMLIFVVPVICAIPAISMKYIKRNYFPNMKQLIQEAMKKGMTREDIFGRVDEEQVQKPNTKMPKFTQRNGFVNPSLFNFDEDDNIGLELRMYKPDLRRERMRALKRSGSDTQLDVVGIASQNKSTTTSHRRARSEGIRLDTNFNSGVAEANRLWAEKQAGENDVAADNLNTMPRRRKPRVQFQDAQVADDKEQEEEIQPSGSDHLKRKNSL